MWKSLQEMAGFPPSRLSIWSAIRQSRFYRSIIYVFLPAFILLQVSMNVRDIRTFNGSYFSSLTGRKSVLFTNIQSTKYDPNVAKRKPSEKKPFRLTVCAMVHNEVPYLIEWIEFHRLQGADHFVLYNYYSTDSMEYLPMLYEPHRTNVTVHIFPARFFGNDRNDANFHQTSEYAMVDCYVRYRQHSQWLLLATAGHFVFSPAHTSVWSYLEKAEGNTGAVRVPTLKFGTSGLSKKFRTWLGPDSFTGTVDLLYEPVNDTDAYPLLLEINRFRAPHPALDGTGVSARNCEKDGEKATTPCVESSHLTLISGERYCTKHNISKCLYPHTDTAFPSFSMLRADNHEWRSAEHAQSLTQLGLVNTSHYQLLDQRYSRILDTLKLDNYGREMRENIMRLKPKIFLDVGRECDTRALDSGQQVKCPADFPYPYGNDGLRRLMKCCKYDLDNGRKQLTEQSGNCWNNSFVECKEPMGKKKWLHRSCCMQARSVMAVQADGHEYQIQ